MADNEYNTVALLKDPDGVFAHITSRKNRNGILQYSFSFYREFEKNGETHKTTWFSPRHMPALVRLTHDVQETLKLERERSSTMRM